MKIQIKDTINKAKINNKLGIISTLKRKGFLGYFTDEEALTFDNYYYYGHSGEKFLSPLFEKLIKDREQYNNIINEDYDYVTVNHHKIVITNGVNKLNVVDELADIIGSKFKNSWQKIFNALTLDYNADVNQDYKETKKYNENLSKNYDTTITGEDKHTTNLTETNTNNADDSIYGFNSNTPSPTDKTSTNGTTTTVGNGEDNKVNSLDRKTGNDVHTTKGDYNIEHYGVKDITHQELIEKEIEMRKSNIMLNVIFTDVDSVLTLSIY